MIQILAGGLVGALLATIIQIWFQRLRLRADVMMAVVAWADEVYERVVDLRIQKVAIYSNEKPFLADEEYKANSLELRGKLLRGDVRVRLALVYGEGEELKALNDLRNELLKISRDLWGARRETLPGLTAEIERRFEQRVDPARRDLEKKLLQKAILPRWLLKIGF